MSLNTGRRLHGRTWKRLPITSNVIKTVHNLGRKQQIPDMPDGPVFEWGPHIPFLPPVVNDDDANDNVSISQSVTSNDNVIPPLIHEDDDASFQSNHTDDENIDQVLGANVDDANGNGISDGKRLMKMMMIAMMAVTMMVTAMAMMVVMWMATRVAVNLTMERIVT